MQSLKIDYHETQERNWCISKNLVKFEHNKKLKVYCQKNYWSKIKVLVGCYFRKTPNKKIKSWTKIINKLSFNFHNTTSSYFPFNPLIPAGNERSYVLKQTCNLSSMTFCYHQALKTSRWDIIVPTKAKFIGCGTYIL